MDTERSKELWDRLDNEPERAYRAFQTFLSLPGDHRTIIEAYRLHVGNPEAVKPSDTWARWSLEFAWRERAAAYDDHLSSIRREAYERTIEEEAKIQAREMEKSRFRMNELMTEAYHRAIECLEDEDWVSRNLRASDVIAIAKLHLDVVKTLSTDRETKDEGDWNEEDLDDLDEIVNEVDDLTDPERPEEADEEGSDEDPSEESDDGER